MPITVSIETGPAPYGNKKLVTGTITMDSSYPTGGEAYVAGQFRMGRLTRLQLFPADAYIPDVDFANSKIKVFAIPAIAVHTHGFTGSALATHTHKQQITTGATAAADSTSGALAVNAAAAETAVRLMGTAVSTTYELGESEAKTGGTPAGTNANAGSVAQKAAEEVANATDLSAVVLPFIAIGIG